MIHTTDNGRLHIERMLNRRGKGIGIRVGVKTTGCSGLAYVLEYVDQPTDVDHVYDHGTVKVFCDPKHLAYLDETTIDYVRNGLNEGFEFINPKERNKCGCGESFQV